MDFNKHSNLEGKHAFLSGSNYHWLGYSTEKLMRVFDNLKAKHRGTQLHEFAENAINLKVKLEHNDDTINMYVNDCIEDNLSPEVVLYYSPHAFGTADAISFDGSVLAIYDLKTGKTSASMKQLLIYATFFCLEYGINPSDIQIELRIYQLGEVIVHHPEPEEIWNIIDILVTFNELLGPTAAEGVEL